MAPSGVILTSPRSPRDIAVSVTPVPPAQEPASVDIFDPEVFKSDQVDRSHRPTCVHCHWTRGSPDRPTALCCRFNLKNISINVAPTGDMKRGGITYGDPVTTGDDPTGAHLGLRMIAAAISLCLLLGVTLFLFHITKRKRLNDSLRREQREQRALYRRHLPPLAPLPYHHHDCEGIGGALLSPLPPLPPPYPLISGGGHLILPKAPEDPPPPYEERASEGQSHQDRLGYIPWNPATLLPSSSGLTASHVSVFDHLPEGYHLLPPFPLPDDHNAWCPLPPPLPPSSLPLLRSPPGPSSSAGTVAITTVESATAAAGVGGTTSSDGTAYKEYGFIDGSGGGSSLQVADVETGESNVCTNVSLAVSSTSQQSRTPSES